VNLNALSVDLEEYFQVSNFEQIIDRKSWPALPSRVAASTHQLLDSFDATGSRATFFVLGWVAERAPELVREIAERGHEIACHGYGHQLVYDIGPERFREDIQRARKVIEDATGITPHGYRAPSYSITERSLWALDILVEEGFDYDSSIFPIKHHRYGIPDFPRLPVRIQLEGGRSIREFPMTTLPAGRTKLPLAGGAYLRFFPPALFRWGFRRLIAAGEPIVLYVHPWEIDPEQPVQDVSLKVRINHYYNLGRTQKRLEGLLQEFSFQPLETVLEDLEAHSGLPNYEEMSKLDRVELAELAQAANQAL
jgi:polysaccharide deacetylase family protein (PEP-CTERM system associated)